MLSRARIHGLVTNRDLLVSILRDPTFQAGEVSSTDFLDRLRRTGLDRAVSADAAAVAAAIALAEPRARSAPSSGASRSPGATWRPSRSAPCSSDGAEVTAEWWGGRDGYAIDSHQVVAASPTEVTLETDGVRATYRIAVNGADVDVDGARPHAADARAAVRGPAEQVASGACWRRCRARSSPWPVEAGSGSRPDSRCSCSRR